MKLDVRARAESTALGAVLAFVSFALVSCRAPYPHDELLDAWARDLIVPLHETLVRECESLERSLDALVTEASPETLEAARSAWRLSAVVWQEVALYRFDRMILSHNQISKRPADSEFIERTIAEPPAVLDADFVARVGSLSKGLSAIEYLLFEPAEPDAWLEQAREEPARMAYAVAAGAHLVSSAEQVLDRWLPEGGNYLETFLRGDGETEGFRRSLGKLYNRVVAVLEETVREHLGKPLGGGAQEALPEFVEAPASASSLALVKSRLAGIERVFFSPNAESGEGESASSVASDSPRLANYVEHLGLDWNGQPFVEELRLRFASARGALDAVPEPLARAVVEHPAEVEQAYDELRELLVLIKVDLANQLGVTLTFNDNDGD